MRLDKSKQGQEKSKRLLALLLVGLLILVSISGCGGKREEASVHMAVEFVDHAACAHIAKDKGWFEAEGLNITSYDNYITGVGLAAALGK